MIYTSARFANTEHTLVTGTDAQGNTETVPVDYALFRQPDHGPSGFVASGGAISDYIAPPPVVVPPQPVLFASAGVVISGGAIQTIELAAQLQGSLYEDGWLMIWFADPLPAASYLIFAQTDVPARIEQFKSEGSFELVFSDANGDPVEPGRIDLQILKVR